MADKTTPWTGSSPQALPIRALEGGSVLVHWRSGVSCVCVLRGSFLEVAAGGQMFSSPKRNSYSVCLGRS